MGLSEITRAPAAVPDPAEKVNVFISYAKADGIIAKALYDELREVSRDRVTCFLDTESIDIGKPWEPTLNATLEAADWLVCIYTGEQSEFCGYEIGVFSKVNELAPGTHDSRLVCLHDVEDLPAVFRSHQNKMVLFPPDPSPTSTPLDEEKFYTQSSLAQFFMAFYKYKNLYFARDAAEGQRQQQTLSGQVKRVTAAFQAARRSDVRFDTPTQLGVEVSVPSSATAELAEIPSTAEVTGTFQSLALFGLMPPMQEKRLPKTSWGQVRAAAQTAYRRLEPSMEFLERDMIDAANGRVLSGLEATFVSEGKVYRPILARHVQYWSGDHRFQVLFVETLPRHFLGKKHTSLILAGLLIASRFRFAYLEEPDLVTAKFSDDLPDDAFEANCWQLYYDLERSHHEAVELGLLNPAEFIKAFGEERRGIAESLLKTSAEARERLSAILPTPGQHVGPQNRQKVKQVVLNYLHDVAPINGRFLTEGLEVLRQEIASQVGLPTAET
jgi:TIR domain